MRLTSLSRPYEQDKFQLAQTYKLLYQSNHISAHDSTDLYPSRHYRRASARMYTDLHAAIQSMAPYFGMEMTVEVLPKTTIRYWEQVGYVKAYRDTITVIVITAELIS